MGNDREELFGTGTFLVRSALTIYLWSASFGDITRCDQNFVYYWSHQNEIKSWAWVSHSCMRGNFHVVHNSHLMQGFHVFQLIFQFSECWSGIRVVFPAFHHDLIPSIFQNWSVRDLRKVSFFPTKENESKKENLQIFIHMMWFRHPVSLLKYVCNFFSIHSWVRWTTW